MVVELQLHPEHDGSMGLRRLIFFILLAFSAVFLPADGDLSITITQYRYEDYTRHPRMEEEDRLRGRRFQFTPGLEIISNIDDVEVSIFDEKVGRTPWESGNLSPGAYRIRLNRRGFTPREMWIDVITDRRVVVVVDLSETTGVLRLKQLPTDAEVTFNRVPLNDDVVEVNAGPGLLVVKAFGWETVEKSLEVPAGGEVMWEFRGRPTRFTLSNLSVTPRSLPPNDTRGFVISWKASSPGEGEITIRDARGRVIHSAPIEISAPRETFFWNPSAQKDLPDGSYVVRIVGTGKDSGQAEAETGLTIDSRFARSPRTFSAGRPGLLYAPGAVMLPPGIWQASTGVNVNIGEGAPVHASMRFSPAARWEFHTGFTAIVRDPFDTTGIGFSLGASWRMTTESSLFAANLNLAFSYMGLASKLSVIPSNPYSPNIPGLGLSLPMELTMRRWSFILSPSADVTLLGSDSSHRTLLAPLRLLGSLSAGISYESPGFLIGVSETLRSPDLPGAFFDWTLWTGLNSRFGMPGGASYIGLSVGLRVLPGTPLVSLGLEFGLIR